MPEVKDRKKIEDKLAKEYSAGFVTDVESETFEPGLNEEIVTRLSKMKNEPQWLLDYRLKAYRRWTEMKEPDWSTLEIDPIDYQSISYYSKPKPKLKSMDEVDPEVLATFEKLGIRGDQVLLGEEKVIPQ